MKQRVKSRSATIVKRGFVLFTFSDVIYVQEESPRKTGLYNIPFPWKTRVVLPAVGPETKDWKCQLITITGRSRFFNKK